MKVILKLVSYSEIINDCKYMYELEFNINIPLNFKILKIIFYKYADYISSEELETCTVTCNSINLKKESINNLDDNQKVYIFTYNTEIKQKLITIFKLDGKRIPITPTLLIDQDINYENKISDANTNFLLDINVTSSSTNLEPSTNLADINKKISNSDLELSDNNLELNEISKIDETDDEIFIQPNMELFNDPDFISLLRIYRDKPNLYKDFYKYINIYQTVTVNNNIDVNVEKNTEFIKNLNLGFSDENIITALKTTSNSVNLAVRYLLNNI
jgi:hypothetical protein